MLRLPRSVMPTKCATGACLGLTASALLVFAWMFIWLHPHAYSTARRPARTTPTSPVVCIDPGHPSDTNSGKSVHHGVTELDVNWRVSLRLASLLERRYGIKVVRTKDVADELVTNRRRAEIANKAQAALALHLHCDDGPNNGFTLYYPNCQGAYEGVTGPDESVIESSRIAAHEIHKAMSSVLLGSLKDRGIMGDDRTLVGHRNGALTTSVFSEVPTVTVEMVFLNNRSDAEFIKSEEGCDKMVEALAAGVTAYLRAAAKLPNM